MFKKILIANRGEIACRIIRTAKAMGIKTVAVYSEADAKSLHVSMADEAVSLKGVEAKDTYLRADKIITAALQTKAEAIHPGYGFLSEKPELVEACAKNKIAFIGPPAAAMRAMGDKAAAKVLMQKAKVPVVPGYHGDDQNEKTLLKEAGKIGYPILIKASAGGGGKGMRIVENEGEFSAALAGAKRESLSSFNDDRVLIEKYLKKPRHIEIQIFADTHGNTLHLWERDCSIQRRHQKVVEEAPAPHLTSKERDSMGKAAIAAAEAVKYVGAGTVEFIRAESGEFYFMEMNTRLQVEHPVTEMIFGLDLVELQLRIAAGEKLPFSQKDLKPKGHAVEARLYAEDPRKNFLPAIGKLAHLVFPDNARIDTGVRAGDSITPFFDPMIAKIISHGKDRAAAIENLQKALAKVELAGLATNLEFLQHVIGHKEFKAGKLDTGFIARHEADLIPQPLPPSAKMLEAACHFLLQAGRPSPSKAWQKIRADATLRYFFWQGQKLTATSFAPSSDIKIRRIGDQLHLWEKGRHVVLDLHPDKKAAIAASGLITAPMPGKIIQLFVKQGDKVESGQPLLILEAMKMEHTLTAPHSGKVAKLFVKTSEQVNEGAELIEIDAKSG